MRTVTAAQITIDEALTEYTVVRYVESALASDLEARAQAIIDQFPFVVDEQDWRLTFTSLAGGGDGGQFMLRMHFVNLEVDLTAKGIRTTEARLFAYQGGSKSALLAAREAVQPGLAALFTDVPDLESIAVMQTLSAGASKGQETMGVLVVALTVGDG